MTLVAPLQISLCGLSVFMISVLWPSPSPLGQDGEAIWLCA
ncbi:MAG: hypothetical protein ACFBSF_04985 [Leptolyngbyaceae cyanobacterium]